jgi:prolyl 4-hydroxylase
MRLSLNDTLNYYIHKNVLDNVECEGLISEFTKFKIAETLGDKVNYREAQVGLYNTESDLLKKVRKIISIKTNTNINNQETPISFIKYETGGHYKEHYDAYGNLKDFPYIISGDRVKTAILYLNGDYSGGETEFPFEDVKIKGSVGDLLVWDNLNKDGSLNRRTLHSGLPVNGGVKYILVIWIREKEFNKEIKKTLL